MQTTHWELVLELDQLDVERVRDVCREALDHILHPSVASTRTNEIWPYDLYPAQLEIGPESKNLWVVVLECELPNRTNVFYLTKGRRDNSVYFIEPQFEPDGVRPPENFILDENFESDVDLKSNFKELVISLLKARNSTVGRLGIPPTMMLKHEEL